MDASTSRQVFASTALLAVVACFVSPSSGQEFRIETDVYVGEESEPVSHTVTLFEKSAVYEFVSKPEQTIVYRKTAEDRGAQFILLDPETQRRTHIDVERVAALMKKLAQWAGEQKDPMLKFSARPQFEETFDADSGALTMANPEWTYRVATVPAAPAELARYRDFTDRYAELTTMLYGSPPPGPRLALNAALANHGVAPVEIRRTIGGDEKNEVRAVHFFSWRLSRDDRARLDEAYKQLASFEKVENEAFLAARAKQDAVRGQSR
jgi:hypothetical protein